MLGSDPTLRIFAARRQPGSLTSPALGTINLRVAARASFFTRRSGASFSAAGVWFGRAFLVIVATIVALTLIGFFTIGEAFPLWMAFVNGGGLILGGLWMRRI